MRAVSGEAATKCIFACLSIVAESPSFVSTAVLGASTKALGGGEDGVSESAAWIASRPRFNHVPDFFAWPLADRFGQCSTAPGGPRPARTRDDFPEPLSPVTISREAA